LRERLRASLHADGKAVPARKKPTIARIQVGSNGRSRKHREESTMSNEQAAPETKGVTAELLATVDLGPEIEGMAGRELRMRMVTIEPGGVFGPTHDHKDRPGIVYILQGTITDHRNGVATDYGPGVGWPEDRTTTHWLENRGAIPAVEISVDIVRQE
jgi:quercetin dioxygenase-like cupin family protein